MVNVVSSPLPTCNSKHTPPATGVIVSPSSMIVTASPVIRLSPVSSSASSVSAVGLSVGISTIRIVGSAYAPPTFCIDQVCVASDTLNTPAHSKAPCSSPSSSPCSSPSSSPSSSAWSSPSSTSKTNWYSALRLSLPSAARLPEKSKLTV